MDTIKRNVAYKIWIADLIKGNYFKGQEQFESGYVEIRNQKISRVNIVGSIVDKFTNENSLSFNLDDGSGVLRLRIWNEGTNAFSDVEVGDIVLVVGKVKEYNGFVYITPEIIKKIDNPLWLKVRKLELVKLYGEVQRVENNSASVYNNTSDDELTIGVVEEKVVNIQNSREAILELIEQLDFGDGADLEEVINKSKFTEARDLINNLLMNGEIFELHKGKLRVMS
ncbi:hypothetical protein J4230_03150 [Candidatus Woesearchaeota archaeon]|nr:hypothetical protein [Candidatus Woesearchaeota archaeon]